MSAYLGSSTGSYGPSKFLVGTVANGASFTTIASAVATAPSGSTILIQPGTYTESIAWPSGLTVQGVTSAVNFLPVILVGNQTFSNSGNLSFSGVFFQSTSGNTFVSGPSSAGTGQVEFDNCAFSSAAGMSILSSSSSGTSNVYISNCDVIATASGQDAINVSNGLLTAYNCEVISSSGDGISVGTSGQAFVSLSEVSASSAEAVYLATATSQYSGIENKLLSPVGIYFAASGSAISSRDSFYTSGPYFAVAAAPGPTLSIGDPLFFSGTSTPDPQITTTVVPGFPASGIQTINSIAPLSGNFSLIAGSNVTLTPGANSITIASTGGGSSFAWNSITASQTMVSNNGYLVASGALSLALPTTSAVGDELEVVLAAGTSWTITQAAGQSVVVGNLSSTVGAGGSVASTASGQTISLVCSVANLKWNAYGLVGNLQVN